MSPIKLLERTITGSEDYPGSVSSLPTKEEFMKKINEVILLINNLEEEINNLKKKSS